MSPQQADADNALLRTSRDIAVRAAKWHCHNLGGTPVPFAELIALTANFLIIVQFFLQWIRNHKSEQQKVAAALRNKTEEDQKKISITLLVKCAERADLAPNEARDYAQSILDVIRPEDLASVSTTSGDD